MATIFVVDDDAGYRGLLRALLEEKGHKVEEAGNGADVLRRVELMAQPPQLFILDLRMPGMGGYELALQLRERETTRRTPILLLSGDGAGVRDLAEREGVSYLQKLVASNEEIVDHVARLLQRSMPQPAKPSGPVKQMEIDRGFRTHAGEPAVPSKAEEPAPPQDKSQKTRAGSPQEPPEGKPSKSEDAAEEAPRKHKSPPPPPPAETPIGKMKLPRLGLEAATDNDKLDEIVLALIWLNQHMTGSGLKSFDEQVLERLHKATWISSPKNKSRWVVLSDDGMRRGKEAFLKHFGEPPEPEI